jgi:hypothetical protein
MRCRASGACRAAPTASFTLTLSRGARESGEPAAYITVFARGLVKHQFTAVFLEDDNLWRLRDPAPGAGRAPRHPASRAGPARTPTAGTSACRAITRNRVLRLRLNWRGMSVSIFDSFLTTPDMIAVFDDAAMVQAMFRFEEALARAAGGKA